jgi:hypothetical protein
VDLIETVHTLVWAAPRCGVEELRTVKEQLLLRYGDEFFVPAIRGSGPHCRVNERVLSRLSIAIPSDELKVEVLVDIAKEFNVSNFDPCRDLTSSAVGMPPMQVGAACEDGKDHCCEKEEAEAAKAAAAAAAGAAGAGATCTSCGGHGGGPVDGSYPPPSGGGGGTFAPMPMPVPQHPPQQQVTVAMGPGGCLVYVDVATGQVLGPAPANAAPAMGMSPQMGMPQMAPQMAPQMGMSPAMGIPMATPMGTASAGGFSKGCAVDSAHDTPAAYQQQQQMQQQQMQQQGGPGGMSAEDYVRAKNQAVPIIAPVQATATGAGGVFPPTLPPAAPAATDPAAHAAPPMDLAARLAALKGHGPGGDPQL